MHIFRPLQVNQDSYDTILEIQKELQNLSVHFDNTKVVPKSDAIGLLMFLNKEERNTLYRRYFASERSKPIPRNTKH